jgi:hypothetical protein
MQTIEYQCWSPPDSPLQVEFPAELLLELGWANASGILYGSRHGPKIRIAAVETPWDEEREKIGVFFSRIRGEVFLTETDLEFLNEEQAELALVVAGKRAGFFVREVNGSIQTVRSHEEFCLATVQHDRPIASAPAARRNLLESKMLKTRMLKKGWAWAPAGLVMLAGLPMLAVFPRSNRHSAPVSALEVRETDGELRISWKPGHSAVLVIEDSGRRLTTPVYADQSNVTYAPQGTQVEVSLLTTDAGDQPRRESALYVSSAIGPR